ncbi:acyltransferase family protein [Lysobacter antibioticus]|nr:acyltransferase [Lysobacter antibioticus]
MGRVNNFDAVRLLAAAAVIFGHAHPLTNTPSPALLGNSVQALAVKIFFVISGYLIFTSWTLEPVLTRYMRKRSLRIFPALIAIILFSAFVVGPALTALPLAEYAANGRMLHYLKNIFLYPVYDLPGVFADNAYPVAVNGSLWSLPVEFAMYLTLPLVCVIGARLRLKWLLGGFALALCAASIYYVRLAPPAAHPVFYGSDLISALDVAPYFMIGAFIAQAKLEKYLEPSLALFLIGVVALVPPSSAWAGEIVLYAVLPISVLSLSLAAHPVLSKAGRYGDFSYGLYLYGFLVQQIVNHLAGNKLSALENALVSLPIALACAALSWHYIEKPMLALKNKKPVAALVPRTSE